MQLSSDEARLIALAAHGVAGGQAPRLGRSDRSGARGIAAVRDVLDHHGAVQLDTISVLARTHELIPYSRLGALPRATIEEAYWPAAEPGQAPTFEYWSHAACILPARMWPYFAFRRTYFRGRQQVWSGCSESALEGVMQRIAGEGPQTVTDLGGARTTSDWWDWSEAKNAVEFLLAIGEVVCSRRIGWRRIYDLPERVLPAEHLYDADAAASHRFLIEESGRALGIGTAADIADVHRLGLSEVRARLPETRLVPVDVEGWGAPAWADPDALSWAASHSPKHRTTLLSPFDPIVWYRPRVERIFGMTHRLEAYTPAPKRVHGYFAMPVLHGGQLIGRVDPGRDKRTFVAKHVSFEVNKRGAVPTTAVAGTAKAIREAASWVGAEGVRVDRVTPESAAPRLAAVLSAD